MRRTTSLFTSLLVAALVAPLAAFVSPPTDHAGAQATSACTAKSGRSVVTFNNFDLWLDGPHRSPPLGVAIPAGTYQVTLESWEPHSTEGGLFQFQEQWFAEFQTGGGVVVSSAIRDIPEDQDTVSEIVGQVTFTAAVTSVSAVHKLEGKPVSQWATPESVHAVCVAIDSIAASTPTPTATASSPTPTATTTPPGTQTPTPTATPPSVTPTPTAPSGPPCCTEELPPTTSGPTPAATPTPTPTSTLTPTPTPAGPGPASPPLGGPALPPAQVLGSSAQIVKSLATADPARVGERVIFDVVLTITGDSSVTGVTLTDTFENTYLRYVSSLPSGCTLAPNAPDAAHSEIRCPIGDVTPGSLGSPGTRSFPYQFQFDAVAPTPTRTVDSAIVRADLDGGGPADPTIVGPAVADVRIIDLPGLPKAGDGSVGNPGASGRDHLWLVLAVTAALGLAGLMLSLVVNAVSRARRAFR